MNNRNGLRCPHCGKNIGGFSAFSIDELREELKRRERLVRSAKTGIRRGRRKRALVYLRRLVMSEIDGELPKIQDQKAQSIYKLAKVIVDHLEDDTPGFDYEGKQSYEDYKESLTKQVQELIIRFFMGD
jgi:hypothetical protein